MCLNVPTTTSGDVVCNENEDNIDRMNQNANNKKEEEVKDGTCTATNTIKTAVSTNTDNNYNSSNRTTYDLIIGFICYHIWITITGIISLSFSIGSYYYPKTIGLYIALPYFTYILTIGSYERKDGVQRYYNFCKHFVIFKILRKYLNIQIIRESCQHIHAMSKQNPDQNYILAMFPHGSYADYRVLIDGMMDEIVPYNIAINIRVLAASILFRLPIIREIALYTGCVDASKYVAERQLQNSKTIVVLPGGEMEQIYTEYGKEKVYIQSRKGFIKLALQYNIPVVPIYAYGVNDYYTTSSFLFRMRLWFVKKLGICIPFAYGAYGSIMCPKPISTTIVVGKPLVFHPIQTSGSPSHEEIQQAHTLFVQELQNLFNEYKHIAGYSNRQLEIQ